MARSFNVKSATFNSGGAQAMGAPVNMRISARGEVIDDSTGVDTYVAQQRLSRRKSIIQISFNDHDDMQNLQDTVGIGAVGTLTIVVPDSASPPVDQTATITGVMLAEVSQDAQHAAFGSHIATFEAVAADGVTNPISWA